MVINQTGQGIGFKISEAYENVTGQAVNITWENIHILHPRRAAIYVNVFAEDAAESACVLPKNPNRAHWLTAQNFTYRDIVAVTDTYAGCFLCSPTRPCSGLHFYNVSVQAPSGFRCFNVHGTAESSSPVPCFVGDAVEVGQL